MRGFSPLGYGCFVPESIIMRLTQLLCLWQKQITKCMYVSKNAKLMRVCWSLCIWSNNCKKEQCILEQIPQFSDNVTGGFWWSIACRISSSFRWNPEKYGGTGRVAEQTLGIHSFAKWLQGKRRGGGHEKKRGKKKTNDTHANEQWAHIQ